MPVRDRRASRDGPRLLDHAGARHAVRHHPDDGRLRVGLAALPIGLAHHPRRHGLGRRNGMTTAGHDVRVAQAADEDAVMAVLMLAFATDPPMRYIFARPADYAAGFRRFANVT